MQEPSAPTVGDKIELKDVNGALLHITVKSLSTDVITTFGNADMIVADVAVLDGPNKGTVYHDSGIFPKILVSQLKAQVGAADPVVLARLGQGIAKAGQSAPWVLNAPAEADYETGRKYEAWAATQVPAVKVDTESPF